MTDIVEFLGARLDEREHLARAVEHAVGDQYDALMAAIGETHQLSVVSLYWRSHDPATVLAEVKAARALIGLYVAAKVALEASDGTILAGAAKLNLRAYGNALRALATAYDQHADYKQAWRVE